MKATLPLLVLFCFVIPLFAQTPDRQQFIRTEAPVIALAHVRVIDGTGARQHSIPPNGGLIKGVIYARYIRPAALWGVHLHLCGTEQVALLAK